MDSTTKCSFIRAFSVSRFPMIAQTELPSASCTCVPTILFIKLETGRRLTGRTAVSSPSSSLTNCQTGCLSKSETRRDSTDLVLRILIAFRVLYATTINRKRLPGRPPAINQNRFAGDQRRSGGGQKRDRPCHFHRLADTVQGSDSF